MKGLNVGPSNGIFGSGATRPVRTYQPACRSTWGQRHLTQLFIINSTKKIIVWIVNQDKGESCGDNAICTLDFCDWRTAKSPLRPGPFLGVVQH